MKTNLKKGKVQAEEIAYKIGDLVFLRDGLQKHKAREMYMVVQLVTEGDTKLVELKKLQQNSIRAANITVRPEELVAVPDQQLKGKQVDTTNTLDPDTTSDKRIQGKPLDIVSSQSPEEASSDDLPRLHEQEPAQDRLQQTSEKTLRRSSRRAAKEAKQKVKEWIREMKEMKKKSKSKQEEWRPWNWEDNNDLSDIDEPRQVKTLARQGEDSFNWLMNIDKDIFGTHADKEDRKWLMRIEKDVFGEPTDRVTRPRHDPRSEGTHRHSGDEEVFESPLPLNRVRMDLEEELRHVPNPQPIHDNNLMSVRRDLAEVLNDPLVRAVARESRESNASTDSQREPRPRRQSAVRHDYSKANRRGFD